jgi:hypothetical protein
MRGAIPPLTNTPSWHSAELKHRDNCGKINQPLSHTLREMFLFILIYLYHVPLAFHSGCEADHSPPSSAEVKEWVELYFHSPNTPSWRVGGAQGQLYLYLNLSVP